MSLKPTPNKKLTRCRKAAGLTMRQLAKKSGVSLSTINRFENGLSTPMLPSLAKLAKALKVTLNDLSTK